MKGRLKRTFLGICTCILAVAPFWVCAVHAKGPDSGQLQYENLKTRYSKIRNNDVDLRNVTEWKALLEGFTLYASNYSNLPEAPQALLNGATIADSLYRRLGEREFFTTSLTLLDRLATQHAHSDLADDALIRSSDMRLYDLHDIERAREGYNRVVRSYADSDMREVARARLRSLEDGDYTSYVGTQAGAGSAGPLKSGATVLVVLDPGHGGDDTGARGQGGLLEKDVSLAIALELERLLLNEGGIAVRLTRRVDEFVPLALRTQFANDFEAELFVSLHTNASSTGTLRGFETFYLDNSGDAATLLLAERENASVLGPGGSASDDLSFMLSDMIQNAKMEPSIVAANTVHRSLITHLRQHWNRIEDLGVRKAPFYVLVGAHMPCVLLELSFIDNTIDGVRLGQREYRSEIAQGIIAGIREYLKRKGK